MDPVIVKASDLPFKCAFPKCDKTFKTYIEWQEHRRDFHLSEAARERAVKDLVV